MNDGLEIKEIYVGENLNKVFSVKINKKFDINNYEEYKYKLNLAKQFRKIEGEFNDNIWKVYDFNSTSTLYFQIETNNNINIALKCFTTIYLNDKNIGSESIRRGINKITEVLKMTNYLNIENIDELESYLDEISDGVKYTTASWLLRFLSFYGENEFEEYVEMLNLVERKKSQSRKLPDYKSIISFDYILNDYITKCSRDEKESYFPLVLWWKITRIIPLRPSEFTKIPRNCVYYDNETNSYYIILKREKQQSTYENRYKIPIEDHIRITKDIYDLVMEYLELIEGYENDQYLLSYKSYLKYVTVDRSYNKYNQEYYARKQLNTLLNKFYSNVIYEKYNYIITDRRDHNATILVDDATINKITLGDTRHFAFCSLILQGLNPLTIARIGGHKDLKSQYGYYNHLENFIESNVYVLSEAIKKEESYLANSVFDTNKIEVRSKMKLNSINNIRDIEDGICLSNDFPKECVVTDCIFCDKFILDLSKKKTSTKRLTDLSKRLKDEIKVQLKLLKEISFGTDIDKKILKCDEVQKSTLKSTANRLNILVGQKILIESYKKRKG